MSTSTPLPSSLTPHVAVYPSEDLAALLATNDLPPLHQLLEQFSPLGQGTRALPSVLRIS